MYGPHDGRFCDDVNCILCANAVSIPVEESQRLRIEQLTQEVTDLRKRLETLEKWKWRKEQKI